MDTETKIDTCNYQGVTEHRGQINVLMPRQIMSKEQALLHAAWLVVMADGDMDEFKEIVEAVQNC